MRLLIAHGSDSDEIDFQGRSTVQHAVDSHCSQALRIILESGGKADPEIPKNHKRSSPLTSASFGGLAGMTKLLLDHGANISASNPEGRTALHSVARSQSVECAEILLGAGADMNEASSNRCTPLMVTIRYNAHTILNLFLSRCTGVLNGSQLLPTIAEYADVETMSILKSRLYIRVNTFTISFPLRVSSMLPSLHWSALSFSDWSRRTSALILFRWFVFNVISRLNDIVIRLEPFMLWDSGLVSFLRNHIYSRGERLFRVLV